MGNVAMVLTGRDVAITAVADGVRAKFSAPERPIPRVPGIMTARIFEVDSGSTKEPPGPVTMAAQGCGSAGVSLTGANASIEEVAKWIGRCFKIGAVSVSSSGEHSFEVYPDQAAA